MLCLQDLGRYLKPVKATVVEDIPTVGTVDGPPYLPLPSRCNSASFYHLIIPMSMRTPEQRHWLTRHWSVGLQMRSSMASPASFGSSFIWAPSSLLPLGVVVVFFVGDSLSSASAKRDFSTFRSAGDAALTGLALARCSFLLRLLSRRVTRSSICISARVVASQIARRSVGNELVLNETKLITGVFGRFGVDGSGHDAPVDLLACVSELETRNHDERWLTSAFISLMTAQSISSSRGVRLTEVMMHACLMWDTLRWSGKLDGLRLLYVEIFQKNGRLEDMRGFCSRTAKKNLEEKFHLREGEWSEGEQRRWVAFWCKPDTNMLHLSSFISLTVVHH